MSRAACSASRDFVVGWLPAWAGSNGWASQARIRGISCGAPAGDVDCVSKRDTKPIQIKSVEKAIKKSQRGRAAVCTSIVLPADWFLNRAERGVADPLQIDPPTCPSDGEEKRQRHERGKR